MAATKITINVVTAPGTNASRIGESLASTEGVAWRNSVDRCDSDGCGRVILDCDDSEIADYIRDCMDEDDSVVSYR